MGKLPLLLISLAYVHGRLRHLPYMDVQMPWVQDAQEQPASGDTSTSMYDVNHAEEGQQGKQDGEVIFGQLLISGP